MAIFKHKTGYRAIVQVDGKRRSKVTKTLKEAKRAEAMLMIELGKSPDPSEATIEDLIDLHLSGSKPRAVTTDEDYRYLLAKVPQWLKDWRIENVTPMMLDQAYKRLLRETWTVDGETVGPLSVHRLRRLHGILSPAFDLAVTYGWISAAPTKSIKPPPAPDSGVDAPDPASVMAVLERADAWDPEFGCALRVVASTGCRRGELCGLQWSDIDFKTRTIVIRRAVSTTTGAAHTVKGVKTGKKGHRSVAVSPLVIAALTAHKSRQRDYLLSKGVTRNLWVFTQDGRNPWRTDYVTLAFTRLRSARVDKDGTEVEPRLDIHLHQLRHHVATILIAAGMDIKTVSGRLGHSRISTTADMYASVVPARDREAADILEAQGL